MLGTLVNFLTIIAGSLVGIIFKKGIPQKYNEVILQAMSLAVILVGMKTALGCDDLLIIIISLALGSIIGEFIGIEAFLERVGKWLESRFASGQGEVAKGFVTAALMFCVGSMAIVGSLESGLTGNHHILFAKATLDGIMSVILTASLGIGVLFASLPVLVYQGGITLAATWLKPLLVPEVVAQMSSTGGLLIMALGLNMLREKKIKVGNMLPAIFIPLIYYVILLIF